MALYAVGDIHGHLDKLDRALELIGRDGGASAEVIFVGDYVDRGPDTRGVIQRLVDGKAAGRPWTFLKGNHDRLMEWFFEDVPRHDPHLIMGHHWLHEQIGGEATLASYDVEVPKQARMGELSRAARPKIPTEHLAFLRDLEVSRQVGDLLFVHAGIRPGVPLADQTEEDMIWIRGEFLSSTVTHPHLVVHGHSPIQFPRHHGNRVPIDGGAAFGRDVVPVAFEGLQAFALTEDGRVPLEPDDSHA